MCEPSGMVRTTSAMVLSLSGKRKLRATCVDALPAFADRDDGKMTNGASPDLARNEPRQAGRQILARPRLRPTGDSDFKIPKLDSLHQLLPSRSDGPTVAVGFILRSKYKTRKLVA